MHKNTRAERHIAHINEILAEKEICGDCTVRFPVVELSIGGNYGSTIVTLVFDSKRIKVTAYYDKVLSYSGKGIAFQEFMWFNKESDKERKEKWDYGIDSDRQRMVFTEKYRMKHKPARTDRFNIFLNRILNVVPQTFDMIQGKAERHVSMCFDDVTPYRKPYHGSKLIGAALNSK